MLKKKRCIARPQGNKIKHTMENLEQHRHTIATPGTLNQSKANKYNQNSQHDANNRSSEERTDQPTENCNITTDNNA